MTNSGGSILNYADKMGTSFRLTQVVGVGPDGKQTLTQSQIYTINEILKNNSISTTYRNLAPTTPDVLAIIPVKPVFKYMFATREPLNLSASITPDKDKNGRSNLFSG